MAVEPDALRDAALAELGTVREAVFQSDIVTLNMVRDLKIEGESASLTLLLISPAYPDREELAEQARQAVERVEGIVSVAVDVRAEVPASPRVMAQMNLPIKNLIAVISGKGCVGNSTVAANMAVALAQSGAAVGLMDADILGPNLPMMMGVDEMPPPVNQRLVPANAYGVRLMSMGFLVDPQQPMVWRGPMVTQALTQLLGDTNWGELDYLIIDMPPGTGDIALTLSQLLPLSGAVVVCTPQDLALLDAVKAIAMFHKVNIPLLGVVENMSYFVCTKCGERHEIFGHGGAAAEAEKLGLPFLGEVPLDKDLRLRSDAGQPIVVSAPDSLHARIYRDIAAAVWASIEGDAAGQKRAAPRIIVE